MSDLYEQAWRINQWAARDDYLGEPADVDQLQREVGALALIVAQLAETVAALSDSKEKE